jgi:hypothetical protein
VICRSPCVNTGVHGRSAASATRRLRVTRSAGRTSLATSQWHSPSRCDADSSSRLLGHGGLRGRRARAQAASATGPPGSGSVPWPSPRSRHRPAPDQRLSSETRHRRAASRARDGRRRPRSPPRRPLSRGDRSRFHSRDSANEEGQGPQQRPGRGAARSRITRGLPLLISVIVARANAPRLDNPGVTELPLPPVAELRAPCVPGLAAGAG